ncbi:MAG: DNA polymerase III subunit gamma/tau [Paludibacteraceae bacterium]|nr:DNA polymerase III subunit gamma/tau [Paludibacteraceae bacterium]
MESYIVSARKYRPSTFESVVGQQVLTTTLKNAIKTGHLAHAYLFCGPRGVGKTTCARIFAKTINCQNIGADLEPCNECESCKAFNEGRSFNIHELDAASNNSVDDIRSLIEQVRIPPQIGKYSVFIIDEVHMLSTAAFNAFLKTLEEPPSYAIFILATTEKHKVLPTILSRCQVYDFNRITVKDIVNHLKYVAQKEGITASDEALNIVAQKADGGMRDALSIFDQLVSFCGNNIDYQQTIETLNVLDYDYYFSLVDNFLQNNVHQSLLIFDEILTKGFQAQHFIAGLSQHLRDVLVSKDPKTIVLLDKSEQTAQRYAQQAQQCSPQFLFKALEIINNCDLAYRNAPNKRLLVEITLVKLCQITAPQQPVEQQIKPNITQPQQATPQPTQQSAQQPIQQPAQQRPTIQQPIQQRSASQPTGRPAISKIPTININNTAQQSVKTAQEEENKEEGKDESHAKRIDEPITNTKLQQVWAKLPTIVADNKRLETAIKQVEPKLEGDNVIVFTIGNSFLNIEVTENKDKLVEFLRTNLNNSQATLKVVVDEKEIKREAYTSAEKYKELLNENPLLEKFTQTLGLQLE